MSGTRRSWSARVPLCVGYGAIAALVAVVAIWGARAQIAGAVVAHGKVQVETNLQVIQHPEGGVVGEILARDGQGVEAGQVLIRFDGTFVRSELSVVDRQLFEIFARKARLEAEQTGADRIDFAGAPQTDGLDQSWQAAQVGGQDALFHARRASATQEVRQLREQQGQIRAQIKGIETQLDAQARQLELVGKDLNARQRLLAQGLIKSAQVLDLQREAARLTGETGRLNAAVAEARTRISALETEIVKLDKRRREDAISRLRDLQYSEIELAQRRISLSERLSRLDVRAPVGGVVFGSRIRAVRSVVRAADPMMFLVPIDQPLEIAARIDTIDVDQVHPGQPVRLRFTAFDQRTTPEVEGRVARVSADAVTDEVTGVAYYEAVILPDARALASLGLELVPGMPVEAYLRTTERTPLEYLIQPLANYF
jgi:HlyD family type I secretion membrane fusion protein